MADKSRGGGDGLCLWQRMHRRGPDEFSERVDKGVFIDLVGGADLVHERLEVGIRCCIQIDSASTRSGATQTWMGMAFGMPLPEVLSPVPIYGGWFHRRAHGQTQSAGGRCNLVHERIGFSRSGASENAPSLDRPKSRSVSG
jgi:hypothetical protein